MKLAIAAQSYADDLSAGLAGEHLVCADLLRQGFAAFRADQNCVYDVGVDLGSRLIRLQVKSTRIARPLPQVDRKHVMAYTWGIRQGKHGARAYAVGSVDGFALVALDAGRIAYLGPDQAKQAIHIPVSGHSGRLIKTFEEFSFDQLLSPAVRTCRVCGGKLSGTRARAFYCSRSCGQKGRRAMQRTA